MEATERNNTVGLVGVITETPKTILEAPDWKKKVYETIITVPRKSGNTDTLILQYRAAAAGTKKTLSKLKKGTEVLIAGSVRTQNEFDRKPTAPSVKIFVEAEIITPNDPPADQQNEVSLNGNVCKDPFLRTTKKGIHVVSLMVAVTNNNSKADFVPCICWGEAAEAAARLRKGAYVEVKGRMQSREFRKYIDNTPYLMTAYEVTVAQLGINEEDLKPSSGTVEE